MIKIIENTLRDGSYPLNFQITKESTSKIVNGLDKLGFEYIEVGHGLGIGASRDPVYGVAKESDEDYIKSAIESSNIAMIGVFFIPGIGKDDDIHRAADLGINFIRIGTNINNFNDALKHARTAKKLNLFTSINLMKSYAVKSYEFSKIVQEIDSWEIADVIYLVDSAGCMLPDEVFDYISRTRDSIRTSIGFHGHNNLSLAIANSLQAIYAGATYIDSCIRGLGRSAGNAQTEIMIYLLQKLKIGYKDIDMYKLYQFANEYIVPIMKDKQGLTDEEIHIGVSKFHSSYLPIAQTTSNKHNIDIKKLIKKVSEIDCLDPSENLFSRIAIELKEDMNN